MRDEDPLELWLLSDEKPNARASAQMRAALDRLSALLDDSRSQNVNLMLSGIHSWSVRAIAPADLPRAHELYRRVFARGGGGSAFVQEGMLEMIARTKDPASTAFWLEILDVNRPRDSFAVKRRTYALAALAIIAIRRNTREAYEALIKAARHPNPEVRAMAALYLGRAYLDGKGSFLTEVEAALTDMAINDAVFGPRFQARLALRTAGKPAPLDHPGGICLFKVSLMRDLSSYRTIAMQSERTLEDLHFAIQKAFDWDADHLYSFFMNGKLHDWRYAFACPYQEDEPPFANEAIIGDLGLPKKHKFLYLFDYGDDHEFGVELVGIQEKAGRGRYPRVVERHGKAPEQYRWE